MIRGVLAEASAAGAGLALVGLIVRGEGGGRERPDADVLRERLPLRL